MCWWTPEPGVAKVVNLYLSTEPSSGDTFYNIMLYLGSFRLDFTDLGHALENQEVHKNSYLFQGSVILFIRMID